MVGDGAQREFDQAPATYFQALVQAGIDEDASAQVTAAYAAYAAAAQAAWPSPEQYEPMLAAYERYAGAVARAWSGDGLAERAEKAYRDYVGALRRAWSQVDENALDPAALATIAQGMHAVAWSAWLSSAGVETDPIREGG